MYSSENESNFGYLSSTSDHEGFVGLCEKKQKRVNKGRWTKEEVFVSFLLTIVLSPSQRREAPFRA